MTSLTKNIEIREPTAKDAELLMNFGNQLLGETTFYVRKPGERANTPEEMLRILNWYKETHSQTMLHAWIDHMPVGEVVIAAGQLARTSKCAQLGIGVLSTYQGHGVGAALMKAAETYARQENLHRIEFTVLHHNSKAYSFYQKLGYVEEGRKRQSVFIDNLYYDEILMGKIISPSS